MDFDQGFDMFSIMQTIFPIFFILVVGIILFTIFRGIREWSSNNKQPRLNVDAVVVSKRTSISGGGNDSHASTSYHVTFQVESGDRMEFSVGGREYGQLAEGDIGELVFQGTRYHRFSRRQQTGS
ncbi:hypothetical protein BACCIP111895_03206 [Neobacillus rhizosphaerae]|uniref:DUF2500 domain-containing protein n=1 Tax=Neobacillus rhizosphaerae TaxID=2880965 RepID=A0ABN8KUB1_9BACI|nr:DUF2500 domain-containing protein [Neobacillus rhizosphaerae]CAH2716022.1 hypothetical protein BACCIP111895_03206 [Neobacillus rhizosphaerae]